MKLKITMSQPGKYTDEHITTYMDSFDKAKNLVEMLWEDKTVGFVIEVVPEGADVSD